MALHLHEDDRTRERPDRSAGRRLHEDAPDAAQGQCQGRHEPPRETLFDIADFEAIAAFAGIRRLPRPKH